MQFVFPGFLWALLLLTVPIAIHLFYFRRYKKVYFTNVHLLQELVDETATRNKLRNFLILLSRLLALAAIIIAFAQPVLKSISSQKSIKSLSIYIDNSWSMDSETKEGKLIQQAVKNAKEIVDAHSENDRFQILTNDFEGKHQRIVSKSEAITLAEEIKTGPSFQTLSKIISRQLQCFKNAGIQEGELYIISDFQKINCELDTNILDKNFKLKLIALQSIYENNLSIDSAYFLSPVLIPGIQNKIIFQLTNHGENLIEGLRTTLNLNGQDYPGPSLRIEPGQKAVDSIAVNLLKPGWQKINIKIKDYPIQFDDQYFMTCLTDTSYKILVLQKEKQAISLQNAISSIPYFDLKILSVDQIDYKLFADHKLIILSDLPSISTGLAMEIKKAVKAGTQLLIFPAEQLPTEAYAALNTSLQLPKLSPYQTQTRQVGKINIESDVYNDVFTRISDNIKLPTTQGNYRFEGGLPPDAVMLYRDGSAYLNRYKLENAYIYYSASPLAPEINDLSTNAELFIPLLFKVAFNQELRNAYAYDLGNDPYVEWPFQANAEKADQALVVSGPEELIPTSRMIGTKMILEFYDQVKKSGIYDLKNGDQVLGRLAFNDPRRESDLTCLSFQELESRYSTVATIITPESTDHLYNQVKAEQAGLSIWWWLICLSLVFIFIESLLLRFWKSR
ncbi:MAG: BatA domain-containing protein [Saprospiraceae bacterium]|nr:BatA domain-containing protein [Saprospiraceae bacterium]